MLNVALSIDLARGQRKESMNTIQIWMPFVASVALFALAIGFLRNIQRIKKILATYPDIPTAEALKPEIPKARNHALTCLTLGVTIFLWGIAKAFGFLGT